LNREKSVSPEPSGPDRPPFQVAVIGHTSHGATALLNDLAELLDERAGQFGPPYRRPQERGEFGTLQRRECGSVPQRYHLFDCSWESDPVLGLLRGDARPDAALLVVAADEGPTERTREQLRLLRRLGAEVVVYLTRLEGVPAGDWGDLMEWDVRDCLARCGYPGDEVPLVPGSLADLAEVLNALVCAHPVEDRPFLMTIENVRYRTNSRLRLCGSIQHGRVRVGDEVEIVGLPDGPRRAVVARSPDLSTNARGVVGVVWVTLEGAEPAVAPGQVLATPGSIAAHTRFEALASLFSWSSRPIPPVCPGYRVEVSLLGAWRSAVCTLGPGEEWFAGTYAEVAVELLTPVAVAEGVRFTLGNCSSYAGYGVVTALG
jgi:elongation factor Tu